MRCLLMVIDLIKTTAHRGGGQTSRPGGLTGPPEMSSVTPHRASFHFNHTCQYLGNNGSRPFQLTLQFRVMTYESMPTSIVPSQTRMNVTACASEVVFYDDESLMFATRGCSHIHAPPRGSGDLTRAVSAHPAGHGLFNLRLPVGND